LSALSRPRRPPAGRPGIPETQVGRRVLELALAAGPSVALVRALLDPPWMTERDPTFLPLSGAPATTDPDGQGPSGVDVMPWNAGSTLVRLWGGFPTGWAGALCLGLSEAGIAVVRGFARRTALRRWEAEFQLLPVQRKRFLGDLDFLALAAGLDRSVAAAPVTLDRFTVERDPGTGSLLVELEGRDRIGFLGSLLDRFAALSLFPDEMSVETRHDIAADRFSLRALGGRAPSEQAQGALATLLEDLRERQGRRGKG
jgi:hypothetical protein